MEGLPLRLHMIFDGTTALGVLAGGNPSVVVVVAERRVQGEKDPVSSGFPCDYYCCRDMNNPK